LGSEVVVAAGVMVISSRNLTSLFTELFGPFFEFCAEVRPPRQRKMVAVKRMCLVIRFSFGDWMADENRKIFPQMWINSNVSFP
jgi:hypothetical protein